MTKGDSTKWDKSEQNQEKIMDLVDEWDGKDEEIKLELLLSIVVQYARINDVELHPNKEIDTPESNDFVKYCKSVVMPVDASKGTKKMRDFAVYALRNYGLVFQYVDDNDTVPNLRRLSDKELELLVESNDEGYIYEEMKKRFLQARYPTVEDKKEVIEKDMDSLIDHIEQNEDNEVRPEVVAKLSKYLEGYDDAPGVYRMMRLMTYMAAEKKGWDEAEIEKVLNEEVKDRFNSGKISAKEFQKIKKVVLRETDKKIQLWESGK